MADERLFFRSHAIQRMFSRGFSEVEVREVLEVGEIIETNPDDLPYPSRVMLGFPAGRAMHVVGSDDQNENAIIVITVYEPDPEQWTTGYRRRKILSAVYINMHSLIKGWPR